MLSYDTTARRSPSRLQLAPCAHAYLRSIADRREALARRVCDLCDYDLPSVNLTELLRQIDAAPSLRHLDDLDRVISTCEHLIDDCAVAPH